MIDADAALVADEKGVVDCEEWVEDMAGHKYRTQSRRWQLKKSRGCHKKYVTQVCGDVDINADGIQLCKSM